MRKDSKLTARPTKPINYAIGMFGTSIPINMFKTFAFVFYVDHLAVLTAEKFALIIAAYTILDAIDNPVYGFLSDSTRSRWGRRRPWLVIGAPLLALSFIMFFSVPAGLSEGSVFWYALIMYMFTGTLDSMINSNYGALFPELFKTETQRAKTNALRQVFQLVAMIVSIALTPIVTEKIGYRNTSIVYSILAVVVILYMALNSHETPEAQKMPKPNLFKTVWDILRNPKFWIYGLSNAAFFAALAILQQSVSLYSKYVLNEGGLASTIMLASVIVCAILGIPVWVKIMKKLKLMKTWRLSMVFVAVSLIPLFFVNTLVATIVSLVVLGFGYGGSCVTMDIVASRILDEDTLRHGVKREGTFSSLIGVLNKTSNLFVAGGFLIVSRVYGYQNGDFPGPDPSSAARFLLSLFPFTVMIFCVIMSLFLNFKNLPESQTVAVEDSETKKEQ
ncbi:MAG: MFS transporter [Clostridia bacterium]|nr:MFS transporter [Clostridia bacterium]